MYPRRNVQAWALWYTYNPEIVVNEESELWYTYNPEIVLNEESERVSHQPPWRIKFQLELVALGFDPVEWDPDQKYI